MTMYARNGVTLFNKFSRVHRRRQATRSLTVVVSLVIAIGAHLYWPLNFSTDRWRGGRRVTSDSRRNDEDPCSCLSDCAIVRYATRVCVSYACFILCNRLFLFFPVRHFKNEPSRCERENRYCPQPSTYKVDNDLRIGFTNTNKFLEMRRTRRIRKLDF